MTFIQCKQQSCSMMLGGYLLTESLRAKSPLEERLSEERGRNPTPRCLNGQVGKSATCN